MGGEIRKGRERGEARGGGEEIWIDSYSAMLV